MIKHIVMFKLKEFATPAEKEAKMVEIKEKLEALKDKIDVLHKIEVNFNCNPAETWDLILTTELDSLEDVATYANHTVSAMAMLAGFKYPVAEPSDQEARTRNYAVVQSLAKAFKEQFGTIICRELLPAAEASKHNPAPSLRTAEYYAQRPCARYVEAAARLIGEELKK